MFCLIGDCIPPAAFAIKFHLHQKGFALNEIIVSCACCGKRFKGAAAGRRFRCTGCGNQLSFPSQARSAATGKLLCSCCWTEMDISAALSACAVCKQKISVAHGGRAILWAAGSSLGPQVALEQNARLSAEQLRLQRHNEDLRSKLAATQRAHQ